MCILLQLSPTDLQFYLLQTNLFSNSRFKFDLFRGVISEVVNLTKTAEEGIEAAAAATADKGRCGFRSGIDSCFKFCNS